MPYKATGSLLGISPATVEPQRLHRSACGGVMCLTYHKL